MGERRFCKSEILFLQGAQGLQIDRYSMKHACTWVKVLLNRKYLHCNIFIISKSEHICVAIISLVEIFSDRMLYNINIDSENMTTSMNSYSTLISV